MSLASQVPEYHRKSYLQTKSSLFPSSFAGLAYLSEGGSVFQSGIVVRFRCRRRHRRDNRASTRAADWGGIRLESHLAAAG